MNARQAVEKNEELTNDLFNSSKEMAIRLNITIEEAINKKVAIYIKNAKSNNEAAAWDIRGENAKKKINA